eukprot:TRINITY_DN4664_c0_g2_i1.p1 TRINITY_DN4664_c0_g2~~TRINITY_DN4664_c0_g2_i1.p1  ORF type:complete len:1890 (-),score=342.10 TRINITY_DN4664_c0_g2_i1:1146-6815(-)
MVRVEVTADTVLEVPGTYAEVVCELKRLLPQLSTIFLLTPDDVPIEPDDDLSGVPVVKLFHNGSVNIEPSKQALANIREQMRPIAAVGELVDNSVQATKSIAERVIKINTADGVLSVYDNGEGMNLASMRSLWRFGDNRNRRIDAQPAHAASRTRVQQAEREIPSGVAVKHLTSSLSRYGQGFDHATFCLGKKVTVFSKQRDMADPLASTLDTMEFEKSLAWKLPMRLIASTDAERERLPKDDQFTLIEIVLRDELREKLTAKYVRRSLRISHHFYIYGPRGNVAPGRDSPVSTPPASEADSAAPASATAAAPRRRVARSEQLQTSARGQRALSPQIQDVERDLLVGIDESAPLVNIFVDDVNIKAGDDDALTALLRAAKARLAFRYLVAGCSPVEVELNYFPRELQQETVPPSVSEAMLDPDYSTALAARTERGTRTAMPFCWNGRLLPVVAHDQDKPPFFLTNKKRTGLPDTVYGRVVPLVCLAPDFVPSTDKSALAPEQLRKVFDASQAVKEAICKIVERFLKECHAKFDDAEIRLPEHSTAQHRIYSATDYEKFDMALNGAAEIKVSSSHYVQYNVVDGDRTSEKRYGRLFAFLRHRQTRAEYMLLKQITYQFVASADPEPTVDAELLLVDLKTIVKLVTEVPDRTVKIAVADCARKTLPASVQIADEYIHSEVDTGDVQQYVPFKFLNAAGEAAKLPAGATMTLKLTRDGQPEPLQRDGRAQSMEIVLRTVKQCRDGFAPNYRYDRAGVYVYTLTFEHAVARVDRVSFTVTCKAGAADHFAVGLRAAPDRPMPLGKPLPCSVVVTLLDRSNQIVRISDADRQDYRLSIKFPNGALTVQPGSDEWRVEDGKLIAPRLVVDGKCNPTTASETVLATVKLHSRSLKLTSSRSTVPMTFTGGTPIMLRCASNSVPIPRTVPNGGRVCNIRLCLLDTQGNQCAHGSVQGLSVSAKNAVQVAHAQFRASTGVAEFETLIVKRPPARSRPTRQSTPMSASSDSDDEIDPLNVPAMIKYCVAGMDLLFEQQIIITPNQTISSLQVQHVRQEPDQAQDSVIVTGTSCAKAVAGEVGVQLHVRLLNTEREVVTQPGFACQIHAKMSWNNETQTHRYEGGCAVFTVTAPTTAQRHAIVFTAAKIATRAVAETITSSTVGLAVRPGELHSLQVTNTETSMVCGRATDVIVRGTDRFNNIISSIELQPLALENDQASLTARTDFARHEDGAYSCNVTVVGAVPQTCLLRIRTADDTCSAVHSVTLTPGPARTLSAREPCAIVGFDGAMRLHVTVGDEWLNPTPAGRRAKLTAKCAALGIDTQKSLANMQQVDFEHVLTEIPAVTDAQPLILTLTMMDAAVTVHTVQLPVSLPTCALRDVAVHGITPAPQAGSLLSVQVKGQARDDGTMPAHITGVISEEPPSEFQLSLTPQTNTDSGVVVYTGECAAPKKAGVHRLSLRHGVLQLWEGAMEIQAAVPHALSIVSDQPVFGARNGVLSLANAHVTIVDRFGNAAAVQTGIALRIEIVDESDTVLFAMPYPADNVVISLPAAVQQAGDRALKLRVCASDIGLLTDSRPLVLDGNATQERRARLEQASRETASRLRSKVDELRSISEQIAQAAATHGLQDSATIVDDLKRKVEQVSACLPAEAPARLTGVVSCLQALRQRQRVPLSAQTFSELVSVSSASDVNCVANLASLDEVFTDNEQDSRIVRDALNQANHRPWVRNRNRKPRQQLRDELLDLGAAPAGARFAANVVDVDAEYRATAVFQSLGSALIFDTEQQMMAHFNSNTRDPRRAVCADTLVLYIDGRSKVLSPIPGGLRIGPSRLDTARLRSLQAAVTRVQELADRRRMFEAEVAELREADDRSRGELRAVTPGRAAPTASPQRRSAVRARVL